MDTSLEILDYEVQENHRIEIQTDEESTGVFLKQWESQVRPYIEMIDYLRRIGIEKDLALPSIAVVGDQSSGKSSVLEALSGVALPRGSGIVTRLSTGVKTAKVKCWLKLDSRDPLPRCAGDLYGSFTCRRFTSEENVLAGDGVGICDELISLEITSPDVCDLTLIDLPGITRVPVKGQPEDIGDQIRRLILKFIEKRETINLVVVPCNVDIATTEALRMAQGVDPNGTRTLAILTKPDLVDKGAEADIMQVMQGKVVPLKKGYIMVRCRGQSDINENIPLAEATRLETEFFRNHSHFSCLLKEQKASLPSLTEQIQIRLSAVRLELRNYGQGPPLEPEKMGAYLIRDEVREMTENYEAHRGRELITFSDYCVYESLIQKHVSNLKGPAIDTLKTIRGIVQNEFRAQCENCFPNYPHLRYMIINQIDDIQSQQEAKVEKRIMEYINMEKLVYTQDPIFTQKMVDFRFVEQRQEYESICLDTGENATSPNNCAVFDTRKLSPEKWIIYYEIVYQRLADFVPMLILMFILKEAVVMLRAETMDLRNEADVPKLLSEDSESGQKRIELHQRMERLRMAQERITINI
ncbi:Interferon-induced GTP-binding protein Mx1 [Bagarius yarrelli]|uniref:Interferon-induced GTP-binding protein Mx1 n=1 Tax=Bagarius yarrelli TaxID=175774 RepID=A0A556TKG3_BAGYA|nr:Interferon-induced GTP-binding protein Mx1 [Bagarius yarrelli]